MMVTTQQGCARGRWMAVLLLTLMTAPLIAQKPGEPAARQALVDELVLANHILANEGVVDGYGHVSVRNPADPNRYYLARAGAPAPVTAPDIAENDLDSHPP